jgi:hypothetical protein
MNTYLIAAAGWGFAFLKSKADEERRARIDRVNEQLKLLCGPLLACVSATNAAYNAMVRQQHLDSNDPSEFQKRVASDPEGPEAQAYR